MFRCKRSPNLLAQCSKNTASSPPQFQLRCVRKYQLTLGRDTSTYLQVGLVSYVS
uniref:Uncharacterized protein n=1 Tax=Anguilla anguilla TaxID=7936 RepID=A0A0E9WAQ7_ANGAN